MTLYEHRFMRILKYILLLILLAFIGITVYVATQKGDFEVSKSELIKTQKTTVFDYVNDLKNWESFVSWIGKEPDYKFNYDSKTIGAGAKCSFESGSDDGEIKTYLVKENDSIAQKVNFNGTTAVLSWTFKDTLGGTKVTVHSKGKMDIITKITTFFKGGITSTLENIFEKSLRNLDKTLDYEIKTYSIKVEGIVQRPSGYCLKQTVSCPIKSVGKNTKIMMAQMVYFFKKNKIPMAGKPFVNYDKYDPITNFATISICVPVRQQISVSEESDIASGEIIPFTCLKTTLTGDYSHTQEAWAKARKYIADNGLKQNYAGNYTEVYVKTIDDSKHPSQWITEIYIPVFPEVEAPTAVSNLPTQPDKTQETEAVPAEIP